MEKEKNDMELLVEGMMEHVCDQLCRYPYIIGDQEELDRVCAECRMGEFVCGILNTYNRINDFEKNQCAHLLEELARERISMKKRLSEVMELIVLQV